MKSLTSLYILWGVICCLNVCFIFRDATHILDYALESVYPQGLREFSVTLVTKPDIYAPDTLVNTRTGEAIEVAYGQAYQRFWHSDSFQTVPWAMRLAGTLCGVASFCLILWPFRWSRAFFRNIEQGDFSRQTMNGCCVGSAIISWRAWDCWPYSASLSSSGCGCSWISSITKWDSNGFRCWPTP